MILPCYQTHEETFVFSISSCGGEVGEGEGEMGES